MSEPELRCSGMTDLTRISARIVLLDSESRVLLFEGRDLSDGQDHIRFWFTVGGGSESKETLLETAHRELYEETGMADLRLVGPFYRREFDFLNHGEPQHQVEYFFAARTSKADVSDSNWTDLERIAITKSRWWSARELENDPVRYFPENLPELVREATLLV